MEKEKEMKKLILILLLLCVPVLCMAKDLEPLPAIHMTEYGLDADKAYNIAAFVIKTSLCVWGINQRSTYGTTTAVIFGLSAGSNLFKITF